MSDLRFPTPVQAIDATDVIDADHPRIRQVAEQVGGVGDPGDVTGRLFSWVRDEIAFDMAPVISERRDWTASRTLERGGGFCQQKAVLLAALLRARGIPSILSFQDLLDHKIPPHYVEYIGSQRMEVHGLAGAHIDGAWQRLDPSLDRKLCERKGYKVVEYAPGRDCLLPATDLRGEPHFEVLEEFGVHADVPQSIIDATLALDWLHDPTYQQMAAKHGPDA